MTRPIGRNGFGHSTIEAERELRNIEAGMNLLPNRADEYWEWRRIVVQYAVSGVQVHDARLVAAMRTHGVTHILTLDVEDFRRYREIVAVHPRNIPGL